MLRPTTLLLTIVLVGTFLFPSLALAHPADVSATDVYVGKNVNGKKIPDNLVQVALRTSWPETILLIELINKSDASGEEVVKNNGSNTGATRDTLLALNTNTVLSYLDSKFIVLNNGEACSSKFVGVPSLPEEEILFGRGYQIDLEYECAGSLSNLTITNALFVDEFSTQINMVHVYNGPNNKLGWGALTSAKRELTLKAEGQDNLLASAISAVTNPSKSDSTNTNSSTAFERVAKLFTEQGSGSVLLSMLLVFLLGLLHTLEVGHSKTVLISFSLDKRVSYKDSLIYSLIFTLTHVADVILIGIVLLIANSFVDIFTKLSFLQTFSLYALLLISVYMLFTNLAHFFQHRSMHKRHEDDHQHEDLTRKDKQPLKERLILGFIMGLSPCLMGWSIFMVILSTKNIWVLFPVIVAFGLGIFIALALISWVIVKFRVKFFEKYNWIGEISPIVSSALLVIFALVLIL